MKKYIKATTTAPRFEYRFRSPILLTTDSGYGSWFDPVYDDYTPYVGDIRKAIGGDDLVEYFTRLPDDVVLKISPRVASHLSDPRLLDFVTVVVTSRELDDNEVNIVKGWITGQYSDGWGEGFEQSAICSYLEEAVELDVDDETGEEYEYTSDVDVSVYCHPWYSKPSGIQQDRWYIKLDKTRIL